MGVARLNYTLVATTQQKCKHPHNYGTKIASTLMRPRTVLLKKFNQKIVIAFITYIKGLLSSTHLVCYVLFHHILIMIYLKFMKNTSP